jgi:hypothetical protein
MIIDPQQLLLDAFFFNQETCEQLVQRAISVFIQAADRQTLAHREGCLQLQAATDVLHEALTNYTSLFHIDPIPQAVLDCRRAATDLWMSPLERIPTLKVQIQTYIDCLDKSMSLVETMDVAGQWIIQETSTVLEYMPQWRVGCQRHYENLNVQHLEVHK